MTWRTRENVGATRTLGRALYPPCPTDSRAYLLGLLSVSPHMTVVLVLTECGWLWPQLHSSSKDPRCPLDALGCRPLTVEAWLLLVMLVQGLLADPTKFGDAAALCVSSRGFAQRIGGFLHTVRMVKWSEASSEQRVILPGIRAENRPVVGIFTRQG